MTQIVGGEGQGAGSAATVPTSILTAASLADMFPALGRRAIEDVITQCDNNCEVALEQLLDMNSDFSSPPVFSPSATVPQTRQGQYAMLFPSPSAQSRPHSTPARRPPPTEPNRIHSLAGSAAATALPLHLTHPKSLTKSEFAGIDELHRTHLSKSALPTGSVESNKRAAHQLCHAANRGWWPTWPCFADGFKGGGDSPSSSQSILDTTFPDLSSALARVGLDDAKPPDLRQPHDPCQHAALNGTAPTYDSAQACGSPAAIGASVVGAAGQHDGSAAFNLAEEGCQADGDIDAGRDTASPAALQLQHHDDFETDAHGHIESEELAGFLPHLAHCFTGSPPVSGAASPAVRPAPITGKVPRTALPPAPGAVAGADSPPTHSAVPLPLLLYPAGEDADVDGAASGSSSAVNPAASFPASQPPSAPLAASHVEAAAGGHVGYSPEELVSAVDFHLSMFPNLKREVVGDVLQRYSDAPNTGLAQLMMLSACVEDAEAGKDVGALGGGDAAAAEYSTMSEVPNELAWGWVSASDDEEGAFREAARDQLGLLPAERAALDHGLTAGGIGLSTEGAPALSLTHQLQQQTWQHGEALPIDGAVSPRGSDGLDQNEKLEILRTEFPAIPRQDVAAALAACDGSLFAAAELLRAFAAEDAAAGGQRRGDNRPVGSGSGEGSSAAESQRGLRGGQLPRHADPKVRQLAARFPAVPTEALEVALSASAFDVTTARVTLREAGYVEAELPSTAPASVADLAPADTQRAAQQGQPREGRAGGSPSRQAQRLAGSPQRPRRAGLPPLRDLPEPGRQQRRDVITAVGGLSLSEATTIRNQTIFEQERAQAERLRAAYRRCFELAAAAYARGDRESASELSMKGHQFRSEYEEERRRAARRISTRVNQGAALPVISVDLHGQHVDEALALVDSGLRSLPQSIPGGVVVRYITGKGLHSGEGGPRIKPQVLRLLEERGVPFVDRGGVVEVELRPRA